ncbi:MAG: hypothetical protein KatS3mg024_2294 [Armatimonadota bacterium]|nr:MAG: hypothetical protein KatS3mg024_2294 [Armatimonadota bacterium]
MLRVWLIAWQAGGDAATQDVSARLARQEFREVLYRPGGPASDLARAIAGRCGLQEKALTADASCRKDATVSGGLLGLLEALRSGEGDEGSICVLVEPEECRRAVCEIMGLPGGRENAVRLDPGAVNLLLFDPRRGWMLETVNDTEHLRRWQETPQAPAQPTRKHAAES